MPEGQRDIYYITGDSIRSVSNSPFLHTARRKGFEVLYLVDHPIDEYCMRKIKQFQGRKLVNIEAAELDLEAIQQEEKYQDMVQCIKSVLGNDIGTVVLSSRLEPDIPCLVIRDSKLSPYMERGMY